MKPPPYVPLEYRKLKYNEMPEPYKSRIDAWIALNTAIFEEQKRATIAICGMVGIFIFCVLVFLWVTL